MSTTLKRPGAYIREENAFPGSTFPGSAVAVETAVPVFIGYTQTAVWNGKSLVGKPTRISSFAEYVQNFGQAFQPRFTIADAPASPPVAADTFMLDGKPKIISINKDNIAYLFNSIRLFYANGGSDCYILSVGTYGGAVTGVPISAADFIGSPSVFEILEKEFEPTMIVMPDIIALGKDAYHSVYTAALGHCAKEGVQSRVCIFDLRQQTCLEKTDDVIAEFRAGIGSHFLDYGAAYYPWLKTSIVQSGEVTFENLDPSVDLPALLPEAGARAIVKSGNPNYHQSLMAASPTYVSLLEAIRAKINELPPSGAMAGIYTLVDNSRGVWKAPANVSLNRVDAPSVNISTAEQESISVDVIAGKSINVIRPFPGIGTLVWGARTLDGNSQDWRYINVKRTMIMIEQSLKLATRTYVFEPNTANTWVLVNSMIGNFLTNLWKQGALAGAVPEQAFDVQVGLAAADIMNISVRVAISHPAEFMVITFRQQQQLP